MPWSVLNGLEAARRRARESTDRTPGSCQETVANLITQTGALLRRRNSEEMAIVSALITGAPHCVPCISLLTELDARGVYTALERLKAAVNVQLLSSRCTRCARTTTVHVIPVD